MNQRAPMLNKHPIRCCGVRMADGRLLRDASCPVTCEPGEAEVWRHGRCWYGRCPGCVCLHHDAETTQRQGYYLTAIVDPEVRPVLDAEVSGPDVVYEDTLAPYTVYGPQPIAAMDDEVRSLLRDERRRQQASKPRMITDRAPAVVPVVEKKRTATPADGRKVAKRGSPWG